MKKSIIIFGVVVLFSSCASLPKTSKEISKQSLKNNISELIGSYKLPTPVQKTDVVDRVYEMMIRPERGYLNAGKGNEYSLRINLVGKDLISISFLENGAELKSKSILFKRRKGNYLYLKNQNVMRHWIPFLFGGLDVNRTQFGLTTEGDLLFEIQVNLMVQLYFSFGLGLR